MPCPLLFKFCDPSTIAKTVDRTQTYIGHCTNLLNTKTKNGYFGSNTHDYEAKNLYYCRIYTVVGWFVHTYQYCFCTCFMLLL